jgi:hypothetical protein
MGTERGGRWVLSATSGQPKGGKKHHDTIRDIMVASSHVLFLSSPEGSTQWVYSDGLIFVSARTNKRQQQQVVNDRWH